MNAKSHNLIWEPGGRNTHGNWRDWEDNGGETERMEHGKQLTETKQRKQRKEGRGGRERDMTSCGAHESTDRGDKK